MVKGRSERVEICERCLVKEPEASRILGEIAGSKDRSLQDLLRQMQYRESSLREKASQHARRRLHERTRKQAEYEEKLKEYEERLASQIMDRVLEGEEVDKVAERITGDKVRRALEEQIRQLRWQPEGITGQDLEDTLREYIEQGDIDLERGKIRITPKGARKLAKIILRRTLESLAKKEIGPHTIQEPGYGSELSVSSRKYEPGDEYDKVDFEETFLNALERKALEKSRQGHISLEFEDFHVYEEIHQTRMCSGLIIDESGSMGGEKMNAAIDTALALSEMIRGEPRDWLKVYLFSSRVREIPYYELLNTSFSSGTTDIRAAMRAFRKAVFAEKGDRQAYLITDTEPNTEDGRFVGFERAVVGVVQESLYYRQAGITLNIIMLDQGPRLKELASILAKKNLGRVLFTSPLKLGEMVIEDYLTTKRKACRWS